jgi:hypothetical protein
VVGTTSMIGLKRYIRPSVAASVVGHLAIMATGLHFFGARSLEKPPAPEAMVVDIVPPNEAPRLSGTPSNLSTSGTQSNSQSGARSSNTNVGEPQPPKPAPKSPQQSQQSQKRSAPQREAAAAIPQPQAAKAEMIHVDKPKPDPAQIQISEPQPTPVKTQPEETPEQAETAETAETVAEYALLGGPLGGGFQAPPVDTPRAGVDYTLAFRERVSSCSSLPNGVAATDKISVALRVFFNPDGTLASLPQPLQPIETAKQQALMDSSINALQQCQPYTMLPPAKYKVWKKLDLTFYPINALGN